MHGVLAKATLRPPTREICAVGGSPEGVGGPLGHRAPRSWLAVRSARWQSGSTMARANAHRSEGLLWAGLKVQQIFQERARPQSKT